MTRMFRMTRTPGWWCRLWPGSLFGQLSVIVVAGGLAIQLLFSSIWYDVRYSQVLEVPARLVAFRTVETLHKLANGEAMTHLASETFTLSFWYRHLPHRHGWTVASKTWKACCRPRSVRRSAKP